MAFWLGLTLLSVGLALAAGARPKPNLLLIMCDDLDTMLGSPQLGLTQTRRLIMDAGAEMRNYMVSSPKCKS